MYYRKVTVDATRPGMGLAELQVGQNSAFLLTVGGVPSEVTSVRFIVVNIADAPEEFVAVKVGGKWTVRINEGYFTDPGPLHYEMSMYVGESPYFAGQGLIQVLARAQETEPRESYVTAVDFARHTEDDVIHVTAKDRARWDSGLTGATGPTGPTGERGLDGATGPPGPTGARGEDGFSPDIAVVETVGGISVTVTRKGGTETYALRDGADGRDGSDGDVGPTGPTGERGERGETGAQGATGPTGAKGDPGEAFRISKAYASKAEMDAGFAADGVPTGGFAIIDTGRVEDAETGRLYLKGDTGYEYLADLSGAQGIQGPVGATGPTGARGEKGEAGSTPAVLLDKFVGGVQITVKSEGGTETQKVLDGEKGEKGEQGDIGPTGERGATGPTGPQGERGDAGPAGAQGERGETGPMGETGAAGAAGPQGEKGEQGDIGPTGPTGATGEKGDTGEAGAKGAKGDMGATGPTGAAGMSPTANVVRTVGGVVMNGIKITVENASGPTYSAMLYDGADGTTGPTGPQGATGPTGLQGETGEDGATGPTGPKGDKGDPGEAFRIVKTYASVEEMYADAGNEELPLGCFVAIASDDGDNGKVYVTTDGLSGFRFVVNMAGAQGIQGPIGPTGPTGGIGETGPTGPTGEQGDKGPTGPAGATGPQGERGATGASPAVSLVQVAAGVQTNGVEYKRDGLQIGLSYPSGPTFTGVLYHGEDGKDGATGPTGERGPTGPTGPQGDVGATGPTGSVMWGDLCEEEKGTLKDELRGATGPAGVVEGLRRVVVPTDKDVETLVADPAGKCLKNVGTGTARILLGSVDGVDAVFAVDATFTNAYELVRVKLADDGEGTEYETVLSFADSGCEGRTFLVYEHEGAPSVMPVDYFSGAETARLGVLPTVNVQWRQVDDGCYDALLSEGRRNVLDEASQDDVVYVIYPPSTASGGGRGDSSPRTLRIDVQGSARVFLAEKGAVAPPPEGAGLFTYIFRDEARQDEEYPMVVGSSGFDEDWSCYYLTEGSWELVEQIPVHSAGEERWSRWVAISLSDDRNADKARISALEAAVGDVNAALEGVA